jgi:hypothetical protein
MRMRHRKFSLCTNIILIFFFDYLGVDARQYLGYSYFGGTVGEEGA